MRVVVYKNNMTTGRGADRAVATLCGLLAAKHKVSLVTSEGAPLSCFIDPLVHIVRMPFDLTLLAQGIESAKPDVIISTGTDEIRDLDAVFPAAFPAPVIQQFHIYPPSAFKPRRWFRNARTKRALRRCAAIQVLLPEYVELTRKLLHYNGIIRAIGNVAPNVKPLPPFQEKPVILYPAAFHKAKRQDLLLRAFARLKKRVPAAELALAGKGSAKETARLQELLSELGITSSVNFLGYQHDLEPIYAKSALVAFPSRTEGFGLALVEAAAYGRLAVGCADCLASCSLVPKLGGLLAEPTPEALASVLERALQLAPAYSVPTAALKEFSSETISDQWNALISIPADISKCNGASQGCP